MKIKITADTNDGDYSTLVSNVEDGHLETIEKVCTAISNFKPYQGEWKKGEYIMYYHNFPRGGNIREDMGEKRVEEIYPQLTEEEIELFEEYIPFTQWGVHTITSVEVYEVTNFKKLV